MNKFKSILVSGKSKLSNKFLACSLFVVSGTSLAADGSTPDYAGQAMDSLLVQANDFIAKTWPVVVVVVGASLAIRLFKKFSSKAV